MHAGPLPAGHPPSCSCSPPAPPPTPPATRRCRSGPRGSRATSDARTAGRRIGARVLAQTAPRESASISISSSLSLPARSRGTFHFRSRHFQGRAAMSRAYWLRRHSLEVQFWGYETGNIVASITGAGGLRAFADSFAEAAALDRLRARRHSRSGWRAAIPRPSPRSGSWRSWSSPSRSARRSAGDFGPRAADAVNALAVPLALALLGFAVVRNANLFTVAACAFVVGSCLLRGAGHFPLLLKLGGPGADLRRPLARRRRGDGARRRAVRRRRRSASRSAPPPSSRASSSPAPAC